MTSFSLQTNHDEIAFMAHELNTPLMLMKYYAELIKESKGKQKQRFAEAIEMLSGELMQSSQFMLHGMSQNNPKNFRTNPLNINKAVDQRLELFTPLLKQKHITLINKVNPNLRSLVPKDSLVIVLNNLIGNAVKFTPNHGTITIKNHSRIIQVLDTAPAILNTDRIKIFEAFQKAACEQSHSGFGLGLHICSEIINQWGGKIWLKSYPNQGNQFSFTIPNA
ncbi:HAMP domain-containing histidine kinase [Candidatus Peregrinibacteria bacterium]|nr:HAMP domain-containing histidine kinase [bacterium]NCQ55810.1 HAMP domain-containing histidine kinase [Candidatus Parcubacteria bacterium]NCS67877.1 HAMP domain-containing histidine kinase [Candidatus Peregrinibacteria bacterium]